MFPVAEWTGQGALPTKFSENKFIVLETMYFYCSQSTVPLPPTATLWENLTINTNIINRNIIINTQSHVVTKHQSKKYNCMQYGLRCCNQDWKVPSSNPTKRLAGLRDPTSLWSSLSPLGRICKTQVINIRWVRLPPW